MNFRQVPLAAGLLAGALLAACGPSGDPHGLEALSADSRTGAPIDEADRNRDGRVTREEARRHPALAARFERYDRNADGALDRGEFARLEAAASAAPADKAPKRAPMRPREEYPRSEP